VTDKQTIHFTIVGLNAHNVLSKNMKTNFIYRNIVRPYVCAEGRCPPIGIFIFN
jgi:hypothetical protein